MLADGSITNSLLLLLRDEKQMRFAVVSSIQIALISTDPDTNYSNSHSLKRQPTASHMIGQPLNTQIVVTAADK